MSKLGRVADAERELLAAHAALGEMDESPGNLKADCVNALVTMYEAWDHTEPDKGYDTKAAEWRAKSPAAAPDKDK